MGEGKDEVMDYRVLAAYIKLAEGTLRHYVMKGTIPYVKIGTHVRFLKPEIEQWLLERNRRPAGKRAVQDGRGKADDTGLLPWATSLEDKEKTYDGH